MKRIVIIGAGVAGLSAGIYARKNGYDCVILEKNALPGGECTGWDRQGYHVDGCIHWLVGTQEGTAIHALWKETGALDGVAIHHPESFRVVEHEGQRVHFYRDLDRLERSWTELSPEDEPEIASFCTTVRTLQSFEIPCDKPSDLMSPLERIRLLLSMKDAGLVLQKYGKVSLVDYAGRFRHPALREALGSFLPEGYSAAPVFFALAMFSRGHASIPAGGSRALAGRMQKRFEELGGVLETGCAVAGIRREKGRVTGVICGDGRLIEGDWVIAACDARFLYETLLEGRHPDPAFEKRFANPKDYPLASQVQVSLGWKGLPEDLPRSLSFPVEHLSVGTRQVRRIELTHYGYEPGFAPEGQTLLTVSINQYGEDVDHWLERAEDPGAYREEKTRVGQDVIGAIGRRFPDMLDRMILLDVTTPRTYQRWCNAYRGAFMAFLPTLRGKMMEHNGKIRGLDNLFLSGQWLQPPGGLPVALITGRDTVMRICRRDRRAFVR